MSSTLTSRAVTKFGGHKQETSIIFFNSLYEALGSAYDQCGGLRF